MFIKTRGGKWGSRDDRGMGNCGAVWTDFSSACATVARLIQAIYSAGRLISPTILGTCCVSSSWQRSTNHPTVAAPFDSIETSRLGHLSPGAWRSAALHPIRISPNPRLATVYRTVPLIQYHGLTLYHRGPSQGGERAVFRY